MKPMGKTQKKTFFFYTNKTGFICVQKKVFFWVLLIPVTFQYWNTGMLKKLFVVFIRPHLEYAAPAWNPYRKQDIEIL